MLLPVASGLGNLSKSRCALIRVGKGLEAVEQLRRSFAEAIFHLVWFMIGANMCGLKKANVV